MNLGSFRIHQPIYGHYDMDAYYGMGNWTNWVPSKYLLADFRAYQRIYGYFDGCPFWNWKLDQLGQLLLTNHMSKSKVQVQV